MVFFNGSRVPPGGETSTPGPALFFLNHPLVEWICITAIVRTRACIPELFGRPEVPRLGQKVPPTQHVTMTFPILITTPRFSPLASFF